MSEKQPEHLLSELDAAVSLIVSRATPSPFTERCEEALRLCDVVERCVEHGLKGGVSSFFGVAPCFWNVITSASASTKNPHLASDVELVRSIGRVRTKMGRTRAFIRLALKEHHLVHYLHVMLDEVQNIRSFYESGALFLNHSERLLSILHGLAHDIKFDMLLNDRALDLPAVAESQKSKLARSKSFPVSHLSTNRRNLRRPSERSSRRAKVRRKKKSHRKREPTVIENTKLSSGEDVLESPVFGPDTDTTVATLSDADTTPNTSIVPSADTKPATGTTPDTNTTRDTVSNHDNMSQNAISNDGILSQRATRSPPSLKKGGGYVSGTPRKSKGKHIRQLSATSQSSFGSDFSRITSDYEFCKGIRSLPATPLHSIPRHTTNSVPSSPAGIVPFNPTDSAPFSNMRPVPYAVSPSIRKRVLAHSLSAADSNRSSNQLSSLYSRIEFLLDQGAEDTPTHSNRSTTFSSPDKSNRKLSNRSLSENKSSDNQGIDDILENALGSSFSQASASPSRSPPAHSRNRIANEKGELIDQQTTTSRRLSHSQSAILQRFRSQNVSDSRSLPSSPFTMQKIPESDPATPKSAPGSFVEESRFLDPLRSSMESSDSPSVSEESDGSVVIFDLINDEYCSDLSSRDDSEKFRHYQREQRRRRQAKSESVATPSVRDFSDDDEESRFCLFLGFPAARRVSQPVIYRHGPAPSSSIGPKDVIKVSRGSDPRRLTPTSKKRKAGHTSPSSRTAYITSSENDAFLSCKHRGTSVEMRLHAPLARNDRRIIIQQGMQCASCGANLEESVFKTSFDYCFYTGELHCVSCMSLDRCVIPGRVLDKLDLRTHKVCVLARKFLQSTHKIPLIPLGNLRDALSSGWSRKIRRKHLKSLQQYVKLRSKLELMKDFVLACRNRSELSALFGDRSYILETDNSVSMFDIEQSVHGDLNRFLSDLIKLLEDHICHQCELCKSHGFFCEYCNLGADRPSTTEQPLFPFQSTVTQCPQCHACFHSHCFDLETCPKCARAQRHFWSTGAGRQSMAGGGGGVGLRRI
eukprot:945229_1